MGRTHENAKQQNLEAKMIIDIPTHTSILVSGSIWPDSSSPFFAMTFKKGRDIKGKNQHIIHK
jgi:hypothetical protein